MNPKISDFGLAKTFSSNDTEGNTRRIVGTYGYMAPEYASEGLFSIKSDVYSFGVLILEIVMGKNHQVSILMEILSTSLDTHGSCGKTTNGFNSWIHH
ncbi:hypothetical protein U9M48_001651 [Paspalum notatum var. saurae]|uniref:Protein kinase domain-containing protein n=1 Tax=Paspalum notatum var. saurae TaxID=547442 RepID=A0AAQ3PGN8_PASNO